MAVPSRSRGFCTMCAIQPKTYSNSAESPSQTFVRRWSRNDYVEAAPEIEVARRPLGAVWVRKKLDPVIGAAIRMRMPGLRPGHDSNLANRTDDLGMFVRKHEFIDSKDITRTRSLTGPAGCSLTTTALPPQIASA